MATICGFELRNEKSFEGVEGIMYQGDIYFNGQRIGFWSQDSWGGPDHFDFDDKRISERALNDLVAQTLSPITYLGYSMPYSIDLLMEDLLNLNHLQKDWSRHARKGESLMIIASFPDDMSYKEFFFLSAYDPSISEQSVRDEIEKNSEYNGKRVEYYVFNGRLDFNVGEPFAIEQFLKEKEAV